LDCCANLQCSAFYAACQNTADEIIAAQCRGQHAEIFILALQLTGRSDVVDDQIEQG
jgi:hypothetical protein